ncbi:MULTISPECIES: pyruvate, water dikinase regulatory protein [Aminobacterium]|jgi:hypothetical protein|uniref:pyruvate, water dikinase regulatory protein n=1 Tax=Aminobacterium TaxID=81466 RepID=UPI0025797A1D|nr:pyruvate, water dikinase regulatory protein [Aminobacterium sp. UBA4987]
MSSLSLFIVSDSTGETAEHVSHSAMSQFESSFSQVTRFRYVDSEEKVKDILQQAALARPVVVCTLVNRNLRRSMALRAQKLGIPFVDLLGSLLELLELRLGEDPLESPGLNRRMDEEYFRRVKAVEFAIQCDDGRNPPALPIADLVILGVSRTGKTPLSMYIANRGFKVANIPLIPEVDPPQEVFSVPKERLIGLVIDPSKLIQIREERLKLLGLDPAASAYANRERVRRELEYASNIMSQLGCRIYDVTGRAVEENAQEIMDFLRG